MSIFIYEMKKLLVNLALLVFVGLCLGFNVILALSGAYYDYADFVANASRTTGYRLGAEFDEKVMGLEPGEMRDWLMEDTAGMTDVFDGYETVHIADAYINKLGLTGYAESAIRNKYEQLQAAVDAKAESGESLTLYFASATYYKHNEFYQNITLPLLLECGLLAALIMLLSLGYEHHSRTSHIVYATKTGRKITVHKLFAGLTSGLIAFAVLTALTLTAYLIFNDYGYVWGSSVSSGFNYIYDLLAGTRPFITWQIHTVLTYLLSVIGLAAFLVLCFGLIAFVIGMWLKNSYIGFMVFLIVNAACIVFELVTSGMPQYVSVLSPVWLWLKTSTWFTDGGSDILWKNFETLGVSASLVILAGLSVVSAIVFRKRDII